MASYQALTDDEILALAVRPDELTEGAREELNTELVRRKITQDDIRVFEVQRLEFEKTEALKIGRPTTFRGIGRTFFGKSHYQYDSLSDLEEFDTTLWFVLFFFPLVPMGTYRLRRRRKNFLQRLWSEADFTVLEKLPRNWEQIFSVWITAALFIFSLLLLVPLLKG